MNYNIVDRCMILVVAESPGGANESSTIHRKAHDRAVLKRPSDLVTFTSAQVRDLKELKQFLPVDTHTVALESHCFGIAHTSFLLISHFRLCGRQPLGV